MRVSVRAITLRWLLGFAGLPGCGDAVDSAMASAAMGTTSDGSSGLTEGVDPSLSDPPLLFREPPLSPCTAEAPAPSSIRVVSWNIGVGRVTSIEQVTAELGELAADVVIVQEIEVGARRTSEKDQPEIVSAGLGMPYVFAASTPWDGGQFGLAVFSRLRFAQVARRHLDGTGASEPRIAVSAALCLGERVMRVADLHSDIRQAVAARNAEETLAWMEEDIGRGVLIAGDFNAGPEERGPRAMLEAGLLDVLAPSDASPTHQGRRIDFVFADAELAGAVTSAAVGKSAASDHRPLVVDLSF